MIDAQFLAEGDSQLMRIVADTHTHTIFSGHAYSTLAENMAYAAKIGLRFVANTDHTGAMPGAPHAFTFSGQKDLLPDAIYGVNLIRGCEVNVSDAQGALDLPAKILRQLEWVIASMHPPVFAPASCEEHTSAWMQIAQNPDVDVIGHCGDARYPFDYEPVIRAFAAHGKVVEINAHSFTARPGSVENCRKIAQLCQKNGVRIVVSSDAHFFTQIGCFNAAVEMLEEIGFPEELIMNADIDRFITLLAEKIPLARQFLV